MKRIIFWVLSFIIICSVAFTLNYPFESLQSSSAPQYDNYLMAKETYINFVKENKKEPTDLLFLPENIRQEVNQSNSPFIYNEETHTLSFKLDQPYVFGRVTLYSTFFGHSPKISKLDIGRIKPQTNPEA